MSRTVKGRKGPGWEYWGKRGLILTGCKPLKYRQIGRWSRRLWNKVMRRDGKMVIGEEKP